MKFLFRFHTTSIVYLSLRNESEYRRMFYCQASAFNSNLYLESWDPKLIKPQKNLSIATISCVSIFIILLLATNLAVKKKYKYFKELRSATIFSFIVSSCLAISVSGLDISQGKEMYEFQNKLDHRIQSLILEEPQQLTEDKKILSMICSNLNKLQNLPSPATTQYDGTTIDFSKSAGKLSDLQKEIASYNFTNLNTKEFYEQFINVDNETFYKNLMSFYNSLKENNEQTLRSYIGFTSSLPVKLDFNNKANEIASEINSITGKNDSIQIIKNQMKQILEFLSSKYSIITENIFQKYFQDMKNISSSLSINNDIELFRNYGARLKVFFFNIRSKFKTDNNYQNILSKLQEVTSKIHNNSDILARSVLYDISQKIDPSLPQDITTQYNSIYSYLQEKIDRKSNLRNLFSLLSPFVSSSAQDLNTQNSDYTSAAISLISKLNNALESPDVMLDDITPKSVSGITNYIQSLQNLKVMLSDVRSGLPSIGVNFNSQDYFNQVNNIAALNSQLDKIIIYEKNNPLPDIQNFNNIISDIENTNQFFGPIFSFTSDLLNKNFQDLANEVYTLPSAVITYLSPRNINNDFVILNTLSNVYKHLTNLLTNRNIYSHVTSYDDNGLYIKTNLAKYIRLFLNVMKFGDYKIQQYLSFLHSGYVNDVVLSKEYSQCTISPEISVNCNTVKKSLLIPGNIPVPITSISEEVFFQSDEQISHLLLNGNLNENYVFACDQKFTSPNAVNYLKNSGTLIENNITLSGQNNIVFNNSLLDNIYYLDLNTFGIERNSKGMSKWLEYSLRDSNNTQKSKVWIYNMDEEYSADNLMLIKDLISKGISPKLIEQIQFATDTNSSTYLSGNGDNSVRIILQEESNGNESDIYITSVQPITLGSKTLSYKYIESADIYFVDDKNDLSILQANKNITCLYRDGLSLKNLNDDIILNFDNKGNITVPVYFLSDGRIVAQNPNIDGQTIGYVNQENIYEKLGNVLNGFLYETVPCSISYINLISQNPNFQNKVICCQKTDEYNNLSRDVLLKYNPELHVIGYLDSNNIYDWNNLRIGSVNNGSFIVEKQIDMNQYVKNQVNSISSLNSLDPFNLLDLNKTGNNIRIQNQVCEYNIQETLSKEIIPISYSLSPISQKVFYNFAKEGKASYIVCNSANDNITIALDPELIKENALSFLNKQLSNGNLLVDDKNFIISSPTYFTQAINIKSGTNNKLNLYTNNGTSNSSYILTKENTSKDFYDIVTGKVWMTGAVTPEIDIFINGNKYSQGDYKITILSMDKGIVEYYYSPELKIHFVEDNGSSIFNPREILAQNQDISEFYIIKSDEIYKPDGTLWKSNISFDKRILSFNVSTLKTISDKLIFSEPLARGYGYSSDSEVFNNYNNLVGTIENSTLSTVDSIILKLIICGSQTFVIDKNTCKNQITISNQKILEENGVIVNGYVSVDNIVRSFSDDSSLGYIKDSNYYTFPIVRERIGTNMQFEVLAEQNIRADVYEKSPYSVVYSPQETLIDGVQISSSSSECFYDLGILGGYLSHLYLQDLFIATAPKYNSLHIKGIGITNKYLQFLNSNSQSVNYNIIASDGRNSTLNFYNIFPSENTFENNIRSLFSSRIDKINNTSLTTDINNVSFLKENDFKSVLKVSGEDVKEDSQNPLYLSWIFLNYTPVTYNLVDQLRYNIIQNTKIVSSTPITNTLKIIQRISNNKQDRVYILIYNKSKNQLQNVIWVPSTKSLYTSEKIYSNPSDNDSDITYIPGNQSTTISFNNGSLTEYISLGNTYNTAIFGTSSVNGILDITSANLEGINSYVLASPVKIDNINGLSIKNIFQMNWPNLSFKNYISNNKILFDYINGVLKPTVIPKVKDNEENTVGYMKDNIFYTQRSTTQIPCYFGDDGSQYFTNLGSYPQFKNNISFFTQSFLWEGTSLKISYNTRKSRSGENLIYDKIKNTISFENDRTYSFSSDQTLISNEEIVLKCDKEGFIFSILDSSNKPNETFNLSPSIQKAQFFNSLININLSVISNSDLLSTLANTTYIKSWQDDTNIINIGYLLNNKTNIATFDKTNKVLNINGQQFSPSKAVVNDNSTTSTLTWSSIFQIGPLEENIDGSNVKYTFTDGTQTTVTIITNENGILLYFSTNGKTYEGIWFSSCQTLLSFKYGIDNNLISFNNLPSFYTFMIKSSSERGVIFDCSNTNVLTNFDLFKKIDGTKYDGYIDGNNVYNQNNLSLGNINRSYFKNLIPTTYNCYSTTSEYIPKGKTDEYNNLQRDVLWQSFPYALIRGYQTEFSGKQVIKSYDNDQIYGVINGSNIFYEKYDINSSPFPYTVVENKDINIFGRSFSVSTYANSVIESYIVEKVPPLNSLQLQSVLTGRIDGYIDAQEPKKVMDWNTDEYLGSIHDESFICENVKEKYNYAASDTSIVILQNSDCSKIIVGIKESNYPISKIQSDFLTNFTSFTSKTIVGYFRYSDVPLKSVDGNTIGLFDGYTAQFFPIKKISLSAPSATIVNQTAPIYSDPYTVTPFVDDELYFSINQPSAVGSRQLSHLIFNILDKTLAVNLTNSQNANNYLISRSNSSSDGIYTINLSNDNQQNIRKYCFYQDMILSYNSMNETESNIQLTLNHNYDSAGFISFNKDNFPFLKGNIFQGGKINEQNSPTCVNSIDLQIALDLLSYKNFTQPMNNFTHTSASVGAVTMNKQSVTHYYVPNVIHTDGTIKNLSLVTSNFTSNGQDVFDILKANKSFDSQGYQMTLNGSVYNVNDSNGNQIGVFDPIKNQYKHLLYTLPYATISGSNKKVIYAPNTSFNSLIIPGFLGWSQDNSSPTIYDDKNNIIGNSLVSGKIVFTQDEAQYIEVSSGPNCTSYITLGKYVNSGGSVENILTSNYTLYTSSNEIVGYIEEENVKSFSNSVKIGSFCYESSLGRSKIYTDPSRRTSNSFNISPTNSDGSILNFSPSSVKYTVSSKRNEQMFYNFSVPGGKMSHLLFNIAINTGSSIERINLLYGLRDIMANSNCANYLYANTTPSDDGTGRNLTIAGTKYFIPNEPKYRSMSIVNPSPTQVESTLTKWIFYPGNTQSPNTLLLFLRKSSSDEPDYIIEFTSPYFQGSTYARKTFDFLGGTQPDISLTEFCNPTFSTTSERLYLNSLTLPSPEGLRTIQSSDLDKTQYLVTEIVMQWTPINYYEIPSLKFRFVSSSVENGVELLTSNKMDGYQIGIMDSAGRVFLNGQDIGYFSSTFYREKKSAMQFEPYKDEQISVNTYHSIKLTPKNLYYTLYKNPFSIISQTKPMFYDLDLAHSQGNTAYIVFNTENNSYNGNKSYVYATDPIYLSDNAIRILKSSDSYSNLEPRDYLIPGTIQILGKKNNFLNCKTGGGSDEISFIDMSNDNENRVQNILNLIQRKGGDPMSSKALVFGKDTCVAIASLDNNIVSVTPSTLLKTLNISYYVLPNGALVYIPNQFLSQSDNHNIKKILSENFFLPVYYIENGKVMDGLRIKGYIQSGMFYRDRKYNVIENYLGSFGTIVNNINALNTDSIGYLCNGYVKNSQGQIIGRMSNNNYYKLVSEQINYWGNLMRKISRDSNMSYYEILSDITSSIPVAFSSEVLQFGTLNPLGSISDSIMQSYFHSFFTLNDGRIILLSNDISNFLQQNPSVDPSQIVGYVSQNKIVDLNGNDITFSYGF